MNDLSVNFPVPTGLYIPNTLGEIYDFLAILIGYAPRYDDRSDSYFDHTIDTRFHQLGEAFQATRKTLGEEQYSRLIDLAARAKALFLEDPNDDNGKTDQGIALIHEIEDIVQSTRKHRVVAKLPDEDGEVSED
jgi:hypothetical protein